MSDDGVAEWKTLCVVDVRGMDLVGWEPEVSLLPRKTKAPDADKDLAPSPFNRRHGLAPRQSRRPSSKRWNSMKTRSGQTTMKRGRSQSVSWN